MDRRSMQGTVTWIPVGGRCNSRCASCTGARATEISPDGARRAAEASRPCVAVLTGPGEPTIRRDLDSLINAARRGGAVRVALVTNGRMLAYGDFAAHIASLEPSLVAVSILHHDPAVHDRISSVKGAFDQAIAGIGNLAAANQVHGRGIDIVVRHVPAGDGGADIQALSRIAKAAGASALWVDGSPCEGDSEIEMVTGVGIEARLVGRRDLVAREIEGHAPARMHEDEGAVSIVIRTGCRNACVFCTTRIIQESNRAHWPLDDLGAFHGPLADGIRRGLRSLRFVAIEPLEHPDIADLIARARSLGYGRIEAWTSARILADMALASRLRDAGLTAIDVPLLGPDARVHDEVAGVPGSFLETMSGLRNASGLFQIGWHVVVTRQNAASIEGIVELAGRMGLGLPRFMLLAAPSSPLPALYRDYAARLTDVARAVSRLEPSIRGLLMGSHIPPCITERTAGLRSGATVGAVMEGGSFVSDSGPGETGASYKLRSRCHKADRCGAAGRCSGYHALYAEIFGSDEFVPLP